MNLRLDNEVVIHLCRDGRLTARVKGISLSEVTDRINALPIYSLGSLDEAKNLISAVGKMGYDGHYYFADENGRPFSGKFSDLESAGERLRQVHELIGES